MRRLDEWLVEQGLCSSREQAKRAILAGQVVVNGRTARKASDSVKPRDAVSLASTAKYVSRGGFKLEHALDQFGLAVAGMTAVDVGASTGGFTDCLLQRGAARVYAVDVGQGQLAWKLRRDPRVVVMEKTNARYLSAADFPQPFTAVDVVVMDCSFISLRKIIPAAVALLRASGKIVALIKPQFEAGKKEAAPGGGVIREAAIHERVLKEIEAFVGGLPGLRWQGRTESPLMGPAGNKEFLALIEKAG